MKKTIIILFSIFAIFCNQQTKAANNETEYLCTRELRIFPIIDVSCEARAIRDIRFVTLPFFKNTDGAYFSDWEQHESQQFFELNAEYRRRLFEQTSISETDTVFIYDYVADVLLAFPVNKLGAFAHLIWHYQHDTPPHSMRSYEVGVGIDSDKLPDFHWSSLRSSLVYIGQTHPFIRGGLTPIVWERINSDDFPIHKTQLGLDSLHTAFRHFGYYNRIAYSANSQRGDAFLFEWQHYRYYLQIWKVNIERTNRSFFSRVGAHLLVFNTKNNKLVVERTFREDDFIGLTSMIIKGYEEERDISSQWTGYLFRNKPPVVFQFESGWLCTYFIFLDPTVSDIEVMCNVIGC